MLTRIKDWAEVQLAPLNDLLSTNEDDSESKALKPLKLAEHRFPSFTALLPYQYYDKDSQIFFNKTNAGLLYRIVPLIGANEQIAEQLDMVLRTKVSHEFNIQVILVKHNQVGHEIDANARQFSQAGFEGLGVLGEKLGEFYRKAATQGFKTNTNIKARLTHTECFILIDKVKKGNERDLTSSFGAFSSSFEASLTATNIGFKRGDANDFLHLLKFYTSCDPNTIYPSPVVYDQTKILSHQIIGYDFDIENNNDALIIRSVNESNQSYETAVSVLTIDRLPDKFQLWDGVNNSNNIFNPEQSIPCNHIISVTYVVDEPARAEGRANRKTRDLDKKARSDYALRVAGTDEKAKAWRNFQKELADQRTSSVKMLYNVILFSRPAERERDVEAARNSFAYNGIKLALCKRMQMPYFLVSMPFLFTGHLSKDFALPTMMWPISSWNATQYMPLLSDWVGCGRGILLPTMREQFACIDPFSGVFGTNYNIAVTGTSGSGKSFFIQMLILNVLFNGGDVFIIDVGGSYRKLIEAIGGVYLEYDNLAMNPFTHVKNIMSELDSIINFFELLTCPTQGATDDDRGTLRQAILAAFEKKAQQTLVDDVRHALLELYKEDMTTYPTARILAKNLQPYCSDAEHGKVFNQPSQLSPDARIICVDLKGIEDNKSIGAPVLLSIISEYQRRMFDSDRSRQKMCIIDEAWAFFTGDSIAVNLITKGFRTGRRHNASFVTITQGIEDYYEFSEARAGWENSSLKLIFLQDQDSLLKHQKQHETFSEYEINLLKTFPKARDAGFSQVLLRANRISSFHRLFVDPYTRVLLSSDGADYQAVMNYLDDGIEFADAIARVASEHYGTSHVN